ncbi:hypothetical protein [Shewanella indica]|uniref:hypothetical protein n=1 Tax=Shewanella indica TaxID=768528 RepID=UPI0039995AD4
MPELLLQFVLGFALLTGVLGWFALMFASLPGAELRRSLSMRLVRGLFYSYPLWVLVPVYQLKYTMVASSMGLLWGIVPMLPLLLVWLIFTLQGRELKRRQQLKAVSKPRTKQE